MWWPPTLDAERTGFSGAYWPASVVSRDGKSVSVQYDNGDIEIALEEHVFPDAEPPAGPAGFGQEATPLAVRRRQRLSCRFIFRASPAARPRL